MNRYLALAIIKKLEDCGIPEDSIFYVGDSRRWMKLEGDSNIGYILIQGGPMLSNGMDSTVSRQLSDEEIIEQLEYILNSDLKKKKIVNNKTELKTLELQLNIVKKKCGITWNIDKIQENDRFWLFDLNKPKSIHSVKYSESFHNQFQARHNIPFKSESAAKDFRIAFLKFAIRHLKSRFLFRERITMSYKTFKIDKRSEFSILHSKKDIEDIKMKVISELYIFKPLYVLKVCGLCETYITKENTSHLCNICANDDEVNDDEYSNMYYISERKDVLSSLANISTGDSSISILV